MSNADRRRALDELYGLLDQLREAVDGARTLRDCTAKDGWPEHGVYFFFERGETRQGSDTPRVVRVGTHALTATSSTTLWSRLRAHRGTLGGSRPGGGNHRGSIFRLHVGVALIEQGGFDDEARTWGRGSSAPRDVRDAEVDLERRVSDVIGAMDVLWLDVPDRHDRASIERGCIGLLSNRNRPAIDPPGPAWLGHLTGRDEISQSGLWNVQHVDADPAPDVLGQVAAAFERSRRRG